MVASYLFGIGEHPNYGSIYGVLVFSARGSCGHQNNSVLVDTFCEDLKEVERNEGKQEKNRF